MADRVGEQLGNYRLVRLLGEGGFADVYLGEHIYLKTFAAIKLLQMRVVKDDQQDFLSEARTIANLAHRNIVRILDFGVENGSPYLVMEYAPNGTLRERHRKGTRLSPAVILPYVKQIADALQYAHERKLVHRDVKPENMLVGSKNEILLSDFGIALVTQSSRYQSTHEVIGTASYMAPEQLQGKPRPASDQYALGIVVYEWLCGERPFHGSFVELYSQHMFVPPPSLREKVPSISPDVEQVVLTALAKDPLRRFSNVRAFANVLEQASQGFLSSQVFAPTEVRPPASPFDSAVTVPQEQRLSHRQFSPDSTESTTTIPGISGAMTVTPGVPSTSSDTFTAQILSSGGPSASVTTMPGSVPPPLASRRRRRVLVSVLSIALALVMIIVSGYILGGRGGSPTGNNPTATVHPASTSTPNGLLLLTTRTAVSSPTGNAVSSPTGTFSPTPTQTTPSTPTQTPSPSPTPAPACSTPSGTSYFDDFSSYTPGQPPSGYLLRGASGVNPTIQEVGGTGPAYRLLNFPAVSGQYWDRWALKAGLTLCTSFTVTVKLNFQTSGDRGGLTIAWNDATWDRIDIQPNIYWQNIEFRITYTGQITASPSVTGPGLNRYSLPMNVGSDYWLRVVATSAGPGQGQVIVYLSTDGNNFTSEVTATGLATITGLVGVGTAGPNLPNVYFDNLQAHEA